MKSHWIRSEKGVTLIELLIVLVISSILLAAIYRLFIGQTRAYSVQDQVVEVQQNVRSAMEILLRDLRMAGYDSDSLSSNISIANAIVTGDQSVTVNYEYDDTHRHEVVYSLSGGSLSRQRNIHTYSVPTPESAQEIILENLERLEFSYGVDTNDDGAMDGTWISAGAVAGAKVIAVRVILSARPTEVNPDAKVVSPRMLESAVTLRNPSMSK